MVALIGRVLVTIVMLAAAGASAASTVHVNVREEPGGAVAGATVIAGTARGITGRGGGATLIGVNAGTLSVRIEAAGLAPASTDVTLAPEEEIAFEATLRPSSSPGASQLRIAARHGSGSRTFFDEGRLRDLPSSGSLWSLIETTETEALTDRIEGGGLYLGRPAAVGARGSSFRQTSFRLDDVDVSDPRGTGAPLLDLPLSALRAEDVQTALLPVDLGPPGAAVTLLAREPTRTWHGGATVMGMSDTLQAAGPIDAPAVARFGSFHDGSAFASGPLVADRLGLMATAGIAHASTIERGVLPEVAPLRRFLLAHLSATPNDRDELGLLLGAQHTESEQRASYAQVHASWRRRFQEGGGWRLTGAYDRGRFDPPTTPASGSMLAPVDRVDSPVLDRVDLAQETAKRWTAAARIDPAVVAFRGGQHRLAAGASFVRSQSEARPIAGPVVIPELAAGLPARMWEYGYPGAVSTRTLSELSAYVSDSVAIGERLRLDAGARVDDTRGEASGSTSRVAWTTVSPRLSARFDALEHGRLSLLIGYGRYQQRLPLDALAYGDPAAPSGTVSLSKDGTIVARVGSGGGLGSIDPALRAPTTEESLFAIDSRVGAGVVIRFLGVRRRERDLMAPVNVGVPAASYTSRVIDDPLADLPGSGVTVYDRDPASFGLDRYVLTNPEGLETLHEGYEFSVEKSLGKFELHLGATGYRTRGHGGDRGFHVNENDQGVLGATLVDPNSAPTSALAANDRLFFDRSYTLKIASIYRAPHDLHFGVVARYEDGQPFARWLLVPDLNQGPTLVHAFAVGRSRFTYMLTVDARAEKGFRIGRTHAAFFVEGFNLLGTANEVEEDVLTSPDYRAVTLRQPPPVARLGVRLGF